LKLQRFCFALILIFTLGLPAEIVAQKKSRYRSRHLSDPPASASHVAPSSLALERLDKEVSAICTDRQSDPLGTIPIDEMQMRPSLPPAHPQVVEGVARAERLLPIARELVSQAIEELGRENGLAEWRIKAATVRINQVTKIRPEMSLRDNASVYYQNQRTIHFGTIFLASLQSDEGMISIIAHELTHVADGRQNTLRPLFKVIGARASLYTGLSVEGGRPEELTCDMVGVMVAQKLIDKTPSDDTLLRRIARSVEHNCVSRDETDEIHLSPRNTLRALFAVEPTLAQIVAK
jgi:hypothetical protein